ncbi:serine hydrolase domain-containing protein [Chryseobacterium paridis]|uniref:Beta-lactamase family protein n=1 Tax=Chryseobacterium paridis TaxID=2800328 RepID=A0ABS1FTR4_9FLAO|nr:serine hydrolase domain-containing protein [Chryseobacterium paridis]MBK1895824.1 beta-lactamase family protein [Chryseobacterium paridis]
MKPAAQLFFYLLLFFSHSNIYAQKDDYTKKIDSLIEIKNPRTFNGVILVTQNGKVKYSKAYGVANIKTGVPLKLDDQFEIMSNSKQVTAVLLLKEVEKGKVNLQDPIKKYLPTLTQPWADSVTVHQLLNHTHGIVDVEKPLAFKPGTDFKYGNLSNILLGKIIENTSHRKYSELANDLFRELKMKNTFCYTPTNLRNLVSGHMSNDSGFTVVEKSFIDDENLPADGVISTVKDMAIWNSSLHKGKILNPKTYALMTTTSVMSEHDVFGKGKMGYGYAIRIVKANGINYFGHTGLGDGFASLNVYIPQSDTSIIILENQMSEKSDAYYYFETLIRDIVLKSSLVKK